MKLKLSNKAQIKFGETIGVIIIVYIVIMSGLIWYNKINTGDLNDIKNKDNLEKSFEKYYYLNNLNLIHVSQRGYIDEEFDLISLITLSNFSKTKQGKEYLRKQLGNALITLKIYNFSMDNQINSTNYEQLIILYNNTPIIKNNLGNKISKIISTDNYRTLIPIIDQRYTKKRKIKTKMGYLQITNYQIQ